MTVHQIEQASLSARQTEIAQMVVAGKSTREIALALTLSPRTVETHIAAVYNKYGVSSRAELTAAVLGPDAAATRSNDSVALYFTRSNLPAQRATLLGRELDIANVIGLLRESRLVTLTGEGGIGKTRIALAVGDAVLPDFAAGVWLLELAGLAPGSSIEVALARVLGVAARPDASAIDTLVAQLKAKSPLIVLDNCEHLIREAAAVADTLLRQCPRLQIVATSREPLRVGGEQTYRVPPLRVPPASDAHVLRAADAAGYASMDLFAQRARAAHFGFELTDETTPVVADICRRLDGIPLAIELAAARVGNLSIYAIAAALESQVRILRGGDRTAQPRQQSMDALLDWSYDLLSAAEQRLFERLSVFAGGCTISEMVAVYDSGDMNGDVMLDMVSSLADKSLVNADATGLQTRYGMLQTFARYGREKLALRGELEATLHAHAQAYLSLAERLEVEYDDAPSTEWFSRAHDELENWRAALNWALHARCDVVLGQRLAAALRPVWIDAEGGRRWLQIARELIDEQTPPDVVAAVEFSTAFMNFDFGELEDSVAECHRLSAVFDELGNPVRAAQLTTMEATAMVLLGRFAQAEPLLNGALAVARTHTRRPLIAYLLGIFAQLRFADGDVIGGREKTREAIALYESMGAELRAAVTRSNQAEAEFACNNVDEAIALATTSLVALRRVGAKANIAMGLINVAGYCIAAGRWVTAHAHAHEAIQVAKDTQHHMVFPVALQHVAALAVLSPSDIEQAVRAARAARLLGYADACFTRLGFSREANEQREYERIIETLRVTYTRDELLERLADGAMMTPDEAIAFAASI